MKLFELHNAIAHKKRELAALDETDRNLESAKKDLGQDLKALSNHYQNILLPDFKKAMTENMAAAIKFADEFNKVPVSLQKYLQIVIDEAKKLGALVAVTGSLGNHVKDPSIIVKMQESKKILVEAISKLIILATSSKEESDFKTAILKNLQSPFNFLTELDEIKKDIHDALKENIQNTAEISDLTLRSKISRQQLTQEISALLQQIKVLETESTSSLGTQAAYNNLNAQSQNGLLWSQPPRGLAQKLTH